MATSMVKETIEYNNGDKYQGDFVNGKAHGFGTYWFTDKSVYRGGIVNGIFHGEAEVWLPDGRYFKTRSENGKPVQE